ncbi:flagellar motor switch protein FliM [Proteinivorax hydrogeniformans]|uniref:Flagellar motor switch protein FliM n=1 Tax=Proteinivorax hydrogeniformans TaxID=1826727 RepID=A0AAU8HP14_9FIRM
MSEILSQSEIDSLLSALSTGEIDAEEAKQQEKDEKVKVYDFRRPDKFSKDQTRTLQMIHENFARLITSYLSANLRSVVNVSVASVDQATYEEFIRSVPNPTVIDLFEIGATEGQALMEINPTITFSIIDRLMGGAGETLKEGRALTEIEQRVMRRTTDHILKSLSDAWANVCDLQPKTKKVETNPQFLQIVSPNETVVVIALKVIIGENEGFLNLCLPYISLENLVDKLSSRYWFSQSNNFSTENKGEISNKLSQTSLEVIAELGSTEITVSDFIGLHEGDVITLNKSVTDPISILVKGEEKYKAKPGKQKNRLAVQVTEIVEGEELELNE